MRFHSLSDSRRYASDEAAYEIVLHRHRVVLEELAGAVSAPVFALAHTFASGDARGGLTGIAAELADWRPWASVPEDLVDPDDPDDDEATTVILQLAELSTSDPELVVLLRLVADDLERVMIFDASLRWIFSPYDGGADVIADPEVIARLRTEHAEWVAPLQPIRSA